MASDTYIKFGTGSDKGPEGQELPLILGDSDDSQHFWWCELRGCEFELETGQSSEKDGKKIKPKIELKPVSIKKRIDWASTGLFMKCIEAAEAATKKADDKQEKGRIDEVTVHVCRQSDDKYPYLIVKYTGVLITKYGIDMSGPEPTESITFKPDSCEFIYQRTDPHTGKNKGGAVNTGALTNYTPPPPPPTNASSAGNSSTGAPGGGELATVAAAIAAAFGQGTGGHSALAPEPGEANFPGSRGGNGFGLLPD